MKKGKTQTNENSLANLKPFQPGQSGNPNGRPRKYVSTLTSQGYKQSEITDTLQALLSMSRTELDEVAGNKDATALEVAVAKAITIAMDAGELRNIELVLSRAFGSPKQTVDNNHSFEQPLFGPDDDEEETEHKNDAS